MANIVQTVNISAIVARTLKTGDFYTCPTSGGGSPRPTEGQILPRGVTVGRS